MSTLSSSRCLALDLELTCWESVEEAAGNVSEIIQIGVVEVDVVALVIKREKSYLVKPPTSIVSDFCTSLTGVSQLQLDLRGRSLNQTLNRLGEEYGPAKKACFAWGDDDTPIQRELAPFGRVSPFHMIDLQYLFSSFMGIHRNVSLPAALEMLGGKFEGRQHDALVDARNLADLHIRMMRDSRGAIERSRLNG